jgi:hypothetical protein
VHANSHVYSVLSEKQVVISVLKDCADAKGMYALRFCLSQRSSQGHIALLLRSQGCDWGEDSEFTRQGRFGGWNCMTSLLDSFAESCQHM